MRLSDPLPAKLVNWNVGIGWFFFALGLVVKENLPRHIGSLPAIQLPCAFFSSVFIPLGSLLALQALLSGQTTTLSRFRNLLGYHVLGSLMGILLLTGFFFTYFVVNYAMRFTTENHDILPMLVENARTLPTEARREKMAMFAYQLYGVSAPYRLDSGQIVYYVATPGDWRAWLKMDGLNKQTKRSTAFIAKIQGQYPYLVALYAATFTATFGAGWIWLAWRPPSRLVENRQNRPAP